MARLPPSRPPRCPRSWQASATRLRAAGDSRRPRTPGAYLRHALRPPDAPHLDWRRRSTGGRRWNTSASAHPQVPRDLVVLLYSWPVSSMCLGAVIDDGHHEQFLIGGNSNLSFTCAIPQPSAVSELFSPAFYNPLPGNNLVLEAVL